MKDIKQYISKDAEKGDILKTILDASKLAVEKNAGTLKIYYSGHGINGSGNWQCARPNIIATFDEYKY